MKERRDLLGVFFVDSGDGGFVELDHGSFSDLDDHGVFFDVVDEAVDAGGCDDSVAGLQCCDAGRHFLALALLRANEQEIEHHEHQAHHDHRIA